MFYEMKREGIDFVISIPLAAPQVYPDSIIKEEEMHKRGRHNGSSFPAIVYSVLFIDVKLCQVSNMGHCRWLSDLKMNHPV